jgi:hypothetical protein
MPDVTLVNNEGQIIGAKPRAAIAANDMFHSVFVILVTPTRQVVLSRVGQKLSATAVTLCQAGETPAQAATRAAQPAAGPDVGLHHLGDQFYTAPDGRKSYMSVFYGQAPAPDPKYCELLTAAELAARSATCTPALQFVLQSYLHMLPV